MILDCVLSNKSVSSVRIRDVLFVPALDRALFSYRQIMTKGYRLEGENKFLRLIKDDKIWLEAVFTGPLPVIPEVRNSAHLSYEYWHEAIGPASPSSLSKTSKLMESPSTIPTCPEIFHCQTCEVAKSTHTKPKASSRRASQRGEYIHSDLCGPFPIPTYSGGLYYISFVCDKTRYVWLRFLKKKSEAASSVIHFVTYIERQYDVKLKRFRTDNGGEYMRLLKHSLRKRELNTI